MNTAQKIISAIAAAPLLLVRVRETGLIPEGVEIKWSSCAEEQLEAIVEEAIRERLADVEAARKILEGKE